MNDESFLDSWAAEEPERTPADSFALAAVWALAEEHPRLSAAQVIAVWRARQRLGGA